MVTQTVAIAGYSHIGINVRNLEAAETFYGETLGFEKLPRPSSIDHIAGTWYRVGNLQLHLLKHEQVPNVDKGIGPHIALHIPHDAFQDTVETLRGKGVEVFVEPMQRTDDHVWAAFIKDPDGNTVELTDMGPLG